MPRFLAVSLAGILSFTAAWAEPIAEPGSDTLCEGYENVVEGAWTDQGKPALLFRIGRNADNTSCYAWLNAYSNWGITGPGTIDPGLMRVIGNLWQTDNRSLTVDVTGKNATYNWQGVRADGLVFN